MEIVASPNGLAFKSCSSKQQAVCIDCLAADVMVLKGLKLNQRVTNASSGCSNALRSAMQISNM